MTDPFFITSVANSGQSSVIADHLGLWSVKVDADFLNWPSIINV